jgi:hypothetical protein
MFDDDGGVVYKIGRCEDFESRMKGYKFKKIIYTIATDDCYKLENDLKSIIKNKYLITTGTEYFKCDDEIELIHLIVNISLPKKKTIEDDILSIINENKINELKNEMTKKFNDEMNELKNIHYDEIKKLNIINKDIEIKMLDFYNKIKELENKNIEFIQNINETDHIENEKILMKNEDINVNNNNKNMFLQDFIDENIKIIDGGKIERDNFYNKYYDWCYKKNIKQNKIPFGTFSKIMNKYYGIKSTHSGTITYYTDIKFKEEIKSESNNKNMFLQDFIDENIEIIDRKNQEGYFL